MEGVAELPSSWKDTRLSPKGSEKEILRNCVLVEVIQQRLREGYPLQSLLDVGAATGHPTEMVRTAIQLANINQEEMNLEAIEPNKDAIPILERHYNGVFNGTLEEWIKENSDKEGKKFDFILLSHSAYYLNDPIKSIQELVPFLTDSGEICIILEDHKSGKLEALRELGGIDLSEEAFNQNYNPRLINPEKLAEKLKDSFSVEGPFIIPVEVKFPSEDEAYERMSNFFSTLTQRPSPEEIRSYIRKVTTSKDGNIIWNRNSARIRLKPK